ncbi:MAG: phosphatidylglycerophosphatase A [Proteobacteria bacterium]|nr:phosphatidylglycerophosphatase A [Pseudomonadota bacterium]MBU1582155.1 phosphatidylglycerophosphatase A [Pseudomonadota bacterium]MBU2629795.1 phosphatidylglycerophosphatase A [Pseudomonadota bacterium]
MTFNDKLILCIATGCYFGRIPFAPGTFGTLAAVPFALVFLIIPPLFHGVYIVGLILFAVYVADQAEKILKKKDPGCIVIDEIAGYVVTLSVVPVSLYTLIAGFFIFRFFDIIKFAPVRYFEKNFSGGAGVVLDDIMAGILSAVVLRILYLSGIF